MAAAAIAPTLIKKVEAPNLDIIKEAETKSQQIFPKFGLPTLDSQTGPWPPTVLGPPQRYITTIASRNACTSFTAQIKNINKLRCLPVYLNFHPILNNPHPNKLSFVKINKFISMKMAAQLKQLLIHLLKTQSSVVILVDDADRMPLLYFSSLVFVDRPMATRAYGTIYVKKNTYGFSGLKIHYKRIGNEMKEISEKNQKEIAYKSDILCARCKFRFTCRGLNGPMWNKTGKCDEFKRDWTVKLL